MSSDLLDMMELLGSNRRNWPLRKRAGEVYSFKSVKAQLAEMRLNPKTGIDELVRKMCQEDLGSALKFEIAVAKFVKDAGVHMKLAQSKALSVRRAVYQHTKSNDVSAMLKPEMDKLQKPKSARRA